MPLLSMRDLSTASRATTAGQWGVIALGFSIPVSVALDNILIGLIAILWLLSGNWRGKAAAVRRNPVAIAALVLFGLLAIGTTYGSGNPGVLLKYIDLLLIPVFLAFFQDAKTRERALLAFCIAAVASVAVSHLAYLNLLSQNSLLPREAYYPIGFKGSITHSLIVALSAFLFALYAREEHNRTYRAGYVALALAAAHNVVFMGWGRTAYLVLALLFLYFFVVTFGRRGIAAFCALTAAIFATAYLGSATFQQRINDFTQQFRGWQPGVPSDDSVGERFEYFINSLRLIREHPLLGSGTGSFPSEYARIVADQNMLETVNPHNEYVLIAVQIGLVGLASLLYLFYRQWRYAGELAPLFHRDLARGLVLTFAAGCLFNSLLLDHTEGLLFAWLTALVFAAPAQPPPLPVRAAA
ncbi:MAG: O-antigen ligase family protein [Candidatus Colwellbacteria bacterium]|nr:O-antigen ligase family protein [Candidatus Colwellbacteria bacterium]